MRFLKDFLEGFAEGVNDFKFIKQYNYPVEGFSFYQKCIIDEGLKKGIDVSIYAKKEFSWMQMCQLRDGLLEGLDVSVYANCLLTRRQMRDIRLGLKSGVDLSNKTDFSRDQMKEIRVGLEDEIKDSNVDIEKSFNVDTYSNTDLDSKKMKELKLELEYKDELNNTKSISKNLEIDYRNKKSYTREGIVKDFHSLFEESEDTIIELVLKMNCITGTPSTDLIQRYQDLKQYLIAYNIFKDKSHLDRVIIVLEDLNIITKISNDLFVLSSPSNTKGSWR